MKAELTYDQKKDPSSVIHYRVEFGNVLLLHCPLWKRVKVLNQRRSDRRGKETLPHGSPAADASRAVGCGGCEGTLLLSPPSLPPCGRGEAWSERKAPSLGRQSESQAEPLPARSRLPGWQSISPPTPSSHTAPLFGLSSNFPTQTPSECHCRAKTIVVQPSAALGNKCWAEGSGRGRKERRSFLFQLYGCIWEIRVGVGGSLC